jgi:glycosyltransferase involved in cell wall biosynthesis
VVLGQKERKKRFLAIDGSARALAVVRGHLLREAVRSGHSVTACAALDTSMHDIQVSDLEKRYQEMGVNFTELCMERQGLNPLKEMNALFQLWKLMKMLRPDIVLSYSIKSSLYGSLAARLAGIRESYSAITGLGYLFSPGQGKERLTKAVAKKLLGMALRTNEKVFFQNADDRDLFLSLGLLRSKEDSVIVNGSGIDLDYFQEKPLPDGDVTFLMIGRIQHDKGVREYVRAAEILKDSFPYARFQLLGPFDDHPTAIAAEEVKEWQKEGSVEFLGGTPDVRPFLARCHVFVLPSYREGTPRSTLEAMSVGRAVVTTDVPGCRETVLQGENGFLVPARNAEALAMAMRKFLESPELIPKMGKKSRELAQTKYDVHKVVSTMMDAMGLDRG